MGGTKRLMEVDDDSYGTDSSVYDRFLDAELPPERVKGIASAKVVEKLAEIVAAVQGGSGSAALIDMAHAVAEAQARREEYPCKTNA